MAISRTRTHTDDVIEAMQRGVDVKIIRDLGLVYERLIEAESANYGSRDYEAADAITQELGLDMTDSPYGKFQGCYDEIRYRLAGHRNEEIESD